MHFLFLNQFVPPDPAPTARLLGDLAAHLQQQGHTVALVASGQMYHRPNRSRIGRYFREVRGLFILLLRGLSGKHPDVVLSLTSPPCLLLFAVLIAGMRRSKSVHWVMDLYPEVAIALGEVSLNPFIRTLQKMMKVCYRRCALVVGLDADMAKQLAAYGVEARAIRPWANDLSISSFDVAPLKEHGWRWVYSGNLGRAHEWKTLLDAQKILEQRNLSIELVFQGGGSSRNAALVYAEELNLKHCIWNDYVEEKDLIASLLEASVLIVTQKPEAQGTLWPSKLALLLKLPRPVCWVGPVDGVIAKELAARPWSGIIAPGKAEQLADWIEKVYCESPVVSIPSVINEKLQSLELWTQWLESLAE